MYLGNWTEKLARVCARRPWITIGIWVIAIALAMFFNVTMLDDALVTEVEPTNNPESSEAFDIMNERLGISAYEDLDETIIIRSSTLKVDDAEFRSHVEQLYDELMMMGEEVFLGGATYYVTQDPSMVSANRHSTLIALTMPKDADQRMEEVYVPSKKNPVGIDKNSKGGYLLQRIRDEAHRFAVGYHRVLRSKRALS